MHGLFEASFDDLLCAWRAYHSLRDQNPSIAQLAAARKSLDAARERVQVIRRALTPRDDERGSAALTVVCDSLDAPVSIPWQDVRRDGPALRYTCVCGVQGSSVAS